MIHHRIESMFNQLTGMAAQNVSKLTNRLSSSTVLKGSPGSRLFFTPPLSATNFEEYKHRTPEHWSVGSENVFVSRNLRDSTVKSPRARLFKKALRVIEASGVEKENTLPIANEAQSTAYSPIPDIANASSLKQKAVADFRHQIDLRSPSQSDKDTEYMAGWPLDGRSIKNSRMTLSRLRSSQSDILSPLTACSPKILDKYSVQISKITLTPVTARFYDYPMHQHIDDPGPIHYKDPISTNLSDDDVVYFDTPFREELIKKGLDGLDFKPRVLGRGSFGVVVSAFYDGKPVAVKMITNNNRRRRSIEISIHNEENALDILCHPNIVKTLGVYKLGHDHSIVVMEFAGSIHLVTILEDPAEVINYERRVNLARQIADALYWCHIHKIMHLDVKPSNVIVSDNGQCKLGDFGCSRRLGEVTLNEEESQMIGGTIAYRAPELLQGYRPTLKADIYSLGITMWQILSREMPYKGLDPHVIIYKVVSCDTRPVRPCVSTEDIDSGNIDIYVDLYTQLWCRKQCDRPGAEQVIERLRLMELNLR